MRLIALVTADASLPNDFDMPVLLTACREHALSVDVCAWDDPAVDWSLYGAVVLRSPWDYADRLPEFLTWCEGVSAVSVLFNPLSAIRWSLDKHYLSDLAAAGVAVVPTGFVEDGASPRAVLDAFLAKHPEADIFVVKPAVGCYSRGVRRFMRAERDEAAVHVERLRMDGADTVAVQPYLPAIDDIGETNIIYFDGVYSHAIRKEALLTPDGTVKVPTYDLRSAQTAGEDDRVVALTALKATAAHLQLERPLLYARVDLIRDREGRPRLLELEIAEPSLSLPLSEGGASRFAEALAKLGMVE